MANQEEEQYINILRECIEKGQKRNDRTGTGTYSMFGKSMRFNLENGKLPLLTTKSVAFRVILEELLFFVRAQTDNKILKNKKIGIWNGNSTKEFFEKNNINREEDDLGPVYGFQWRHYGVEYLTCNDDYTGKGIDQLQNVINTLKRDPESRRMVVVAWNPSQLKDMALPPCHCMFQFLSDGKNLTCILYQRSADMGLGVPFNICSYSLLTIMIAKLTNLIPYEFVHFIGDAHVYLDHVDQLKIQMAREPRNFPTLKLADKIYEKIEDFNFEDFILEGYDPHEKIVMKMSA